MAHLVNHSSLHNNVDVTSFWWHEVLDPEEIANQKQNLYEIPNRRRRDGTPWFFHSGETRVYEQSETSPCAGAVFYALRDLLENEEIYLNYRLQEPLPEWAKAWY